MSAIKVPYVNLVLQNQALSLELQAAFRRVMESGYFILGGEVDVFERKFAQLCAVRHAVGVANGTDALILALKALGIGHGDEVITVSNSFIATVASVALAGARPVLVDVRDDMNMDPTQIEPAITDRTRAIIPVHLTGRPCEMSTIMAIAQRHNLAVIEDASQAVGAKYQGQPVGSFGIVNCFSLHPLKNLNALGDGGVITTNDDNLADRLRKLRNHGLRNRDESEFWGYNSRLDTLQASFLNVKLQHLDAWTEARRSNAAFYRERLADVVGCPVERPPEYAVYHTFVIRAASRDKLQQFLYCHGVETKVHYPIPIHRQQAAQALKYRGGSLPRTEELASMILSLPVYPELTQAQKELVVSMIRKFYGK